MEVHAIIKLRYTTVHDCNICGLNNNLSSNTEKKIDGKSKIVTDNGLNILISKYKHPSC